jgi:hypothetical protein
MLQNRDKSLALHMMERVNMLAPTTRNDLNRPRDSFTPWIRIRLQREYATMRGEYFEHGIGIALFHLIGTPNGMHEEDEIWRTDFCMLTIRRRRDCSKTIDGW